MADWLEDFLERNGIVITPGSVIRAMRTRLEPTISIDELSKRTKIPMKTLALYEKDALEITEEHKESIAKHLGFHPVSLRRRDEKRR